ncbi:MAG TPA: zf-HC2 domain-containing protein, partial [Ktedonobacteraceae bacterium]|nr:zf-HC2 domain-containing protein [Ktedonobacteraceae bacterium]
MKCEQISELLPDYLQGNLSPGEHHKVEEHLGHCADCSEEVVIWRKLSLLPVEQPSPASRARFEAMLQAYQAGRSNRPAATLENRTRASSWNLFHWLRSPLGAMAWSVALLAIGAYAGLHVAGSRSHSQDLAAVQSELTSMKQLVVLSMLQQQSASERLQGVTWSTREEHLDPQVLSALLHTLRYDVSVDVRLAALDALGRHARQPQIHKGVLDSLQQEQSPLVQVALIDLLLEWRDRDAAQRLQQLEQTP